MYGTGGKEVKVYYRGQRGEGVYDVAFEGLIKMWSGDTGRQRPRMKAEYEEFMRSRPAMPAWAEAEAGRPGGNSGSKNIAEVTALSVERCSFPG